MTEEKLSAREKRAVKRRESAEKAADALGVGKGAKELTINPLNYTEDLLRALNHYNLAFDNKQKRKWVMSYVGKAAVKDFEEIPDYQFRGLGAIIRLKQREQYLAEKELAFIDTRLTELRKLNAMEKKSSVVENPVKEDAPKKLVIDKTEDLVNTHLTELCVMFDEFIMNDIEPDFTGYLKTREVPANIAKQLPQFFVNNIAEITEALEGEDKQLVEGYSFLKKTKLKKLLKLYESIATVCQQAVVSNKVIRKPRQVKEKPASVLVKSVKYLSEFPELGLKSVLVTSLVNSKEVWIYNTKYKKLQVYRAPKDQTMTVKGTSLLNYDVATSTTKTIRKPEQVKEFGGMTRKNFELAFNKLTTKEAAVNGRINDECIILKVW